MLVQGGAWVPPVVGDNCHNAIDVTIYCEGSEPLGACCDMTVTDDAGEAVCRDVPRVNCNTPELWREGETCASVCIGGANDGQPCTRAIDCPDGDCPGPFPAAGRDDRPARAPRPLSGDGII